MTPEALEALIYDRIADLPDVDELDNEQIHAIAHEAALAVDAKAIVWAWLDSVGLTDNDLEWWDELSAIGSMLQQATIRKWVEAIRVVQP